MTDDFMTKVYPAKDSEEVRAIVAQYEGKNTLKWIVTDEEYEANSRLLSPKHVRDCIPLSLFYQRRRLHNRVRAENQFASRTSDTPNFTK